KISGKNRYEVVSPAQAGIDPQLCAWVLSCTRFPRTSGDRPITYTGKGALVLFPPHKRGLLISVQN
ncbi:hypothetical protein, partial [Thiolapillus sp.]|uniref:hypothetical protein n=1 Tax=Thiolapillus sp. TaxID=2017437 RepID=UPI003AF75AE1